MCRDSSASGIDKIIFRAVATVIIKSQTRILPANYANYTNEKLQRLHALLEFAFIRACRAVVRRPRYYGRVVRGAHFLAFDSHLKLEFSFA